MAVDKEWTFPGVRQVGRKLHYFCTCRPEMEKCAALAMSAKISTSEGPGVDHVEPCGCLRAVEVLARDWADMMMGQLALRVWTVNAGRRQEFPLLSTAHGGYEAGRVEVEGDEGELAARRVVCLRATLPKDPSKEWRCTSRSCAARSAFRCKHVHSMNQKAPARGGKNRTSSSMR